MIASLLTALTALWQWVPSELRGKIISVTWGFVTRRLAYRKGRKDERQEQELEQRRRDEDINRRANDARTDLDRLDIDAVDEQLREHGNLRD